MYLYLYPALVLLANVNEEEPSSKDVCTVPWKEDKMGHASKSSDELLFTRVRQVNVLKIVARKLKKKRRRSQESLEEMPEREVVSSNVVSRIKFRRCYRIVKLKARLLFCVYEGVPQARARKSVVVTYLIYYKTNSSLQDNSREDSTLMLLQYIYIKRFF